MSVAAKAQREAPPGAPSHARLALQLLGLWGFAVAQPLFSVLGQSAEFFVAHRVTPGQMIVLAFGLTLVGPAILYVLLVATARISPRLGSAARFAVTALLAGALCLTLLKRSPLPGVVALGISVAGGGTVAALLAKHRHLRSFLATLGVGALAFPLVFAANPKVRGLFLGSDHLGAPPLDVKRPVPVILVVFDELPVISLLDETGAIDGARFPSFQRLAARSHWFRNAGTVSPWTHFAVPAIFTGTYPEFSESKLPTVRDYPRSIFSMLAGSYRVIGSEVLTKLCPEELCGPEDTARDGYASLVSDTAIVYVHVLLPEATASFLPPITTAWGGFGGRGHEARNRTRRAKYETLVDRIDGAGGRPLLFVAHFLLPHGPYQYFPDGTSYRELFPLRIPGLSENGWAEDDLVVEQAYERHLIQLGYADALLGRLLDRLESEGLMDRSLVIVTADHGVSFRPGGKYRAISDDNLGDILPIPLFVKLPGQPTGTVNDTRAEVIDILPTIADLLGVSDAWEFDGRSLFGDEHEERPAHRYLVGGQGGAFQAVTVSDLASSRAGALATKISRVGSGTDFRLDSGWRPRADAGPISPAPTSEGAYEVIPRLGDERESLWPRLVLGTLRPRDVPKGALAMGLAVGDGEVRSTATIFRRDGAWRFAAFLPSTALDGDPGLRLYPVDSTAPSTAPAGRRPEPPLRLGAGAFRVEWRSVEVPAHVAPDTFFTVRFTLVNRGDETWHAALPDVKRNAVRIGAALVTDEADRPETWRRFELPTDLGPGEEAEIAISLRAPEQPGDYVLKVDLVQERVAWFGGRGARTLTERIRVGG